MRKKQAYKVGDIIDIRGYGEHLLVLKIDADVNWISGKNDWYYSGMVLETGEIGETYPETWLLQHKMEVVC